MIIPSYIRAVAFKIRPDKTMNIAVNHARSFVGIQEESRNSGKFIRKMRRSLGWPVSGQGAWCAVFISYVLKLSGVRNVKSRGARRVVYNMLEHPRGSRLSVDSFMANPRPCVAVWERGKVSWQGHVRLMTGETFLHPKTKEKHYRYIAGNEKNRVRYHHISEEKFVSGIIAIARIS